MSRTCLSCANPPERGRTRCAACAETRAAKRAERIARGECVYGSCPEAATGGTQLCPRHREYYRTAKARAKGRAGGKREPPRCRSIVDLLNDYDAVL